MRRHGRFSGQGNVIDDYIPVQRTVNRVCSAYIHDRVMLWLADAELAQDSEPPICCRQT
jgi:hypothetical protein